MLTKLVTKFKKKLSFNLLPPATLILICLYLIFLNHVPGTYLSGWDTLHPEFNFEVSFKRLLFGVFRDEQGLGAVAAHSHMADLPRVVILYFLSFFISTNLLRFLFISSCLVVGVLGVYKFIKDVILNQSNKESVMLAFSGALFYLFNLGTLQHFYVPFEMFNVQYALLPWLFWSAARYLDDSSKRNLLAFSVLTLFSTPMAFASALWYAYFLAFVIFLLFSIKKNLKQVCILIVVTLFINSFWIMPNIYYIVSGNASFVPDAKINKIFSEEAFTHNLNYGNITDALIFKNFLFDWSVYQGNDKFGFLLDAWKNHFSNKWILSIGYINAIIVFFGVFVTFLRGNKFTKSLLIPSFISLAFIVNFGFPFGFVFNFMRDHSALFKEALRFPFTKFSLILMFTFSCFFVIGQKLILDIFSKFLSKKKVIFIQTLIVSIALMIYMFPFFKGQLVSRSMQINIPYEYFQMFKWFNNQEDNGRVAEFPIHSFWGWIYYNFGFQGSQFISFGIKQPLLDRDYDRWNKSNEDYYKQMSYAVYSQDSDLFRALLEKYQISYLIIDKNVLAPGKDQDKKVLYFKETDNLIQRSGKARFVRKFGNIYIYKVNLSVSPAGDFKVPSKFVITNKNDKTTDIDQGYQIFGDYISFKSNDKILDNQKNKIYFPFANLIDNQNLINPDLVDFKDGINLKFSQLPTKADFSIAGYLKDESYLPADLYIKNDTNKINIRIDLNIVSQDTLQHPIHPPLPSQTRLRRDSAPDESRGEATPSVSSRELHYQVENKAKGLDILNIDENQFLKLKNEVNDTYTFAGKIYLSTTQFSNLTFYSTNPLSGIRISDEEMIPQLCSGVSGSQEVGAKLINSNSIKLISKNAISCLKIPLNKIVRGGELLNFKDLLNFEFNVESENSNGHYCIFSKSFDRCIKEEKDIPNNSDVKFPLIPTKKDLSDLELVFYSTSAGLEQSVTNYNNISYSITKADSLLSINPQDFKELISKQNILLSPNQLLKIDGGDENLGKADLFEQGHQSKSCSQIIPRLFGRELQKDSSYIEYKSEQGSSCDYFSFPNLPHNLGYVLEIESQNLQGLPLRLCTANLYSKRCDIYSSIPKNKNFKKNYYLISAINDGGSGYEIHFDNYSIGKITSINRIKSLNLTPFPYNWVSKLHFTSNDFTEIKSAVTINKPTVNVPFLYALNYKNSSNSSAVLSLNKSFDKGWYTRIGEHVLVNGWANGWVIPGNQFGSIIIIFLPQLLEFMGFLFLFTLFVYIIFDRR